MQWNTTQQSKTEANICSKMGRTGYFYLKQKSERKRKIPYDITLHGI